MARIVSGKPGGALVHHRPQLGSADRARTMGRGEVIAPASLEVGSETTVRFHFEAGERGFVPYTKLAIAWRWSLDWGDLQTEDPAAPGFVASSLAGAQLSYSRRGEFNPWNHDLQLIVPASGVAPGGGLEIHCQAWRTPTCCAAARFLLLLWDGSGGWIELAETDPLAIVAAAPEQLIVLAPADAVAGEAVRLLVQGIDGWGNTARILGQVELVGHASDARIAGDSSAVGDTLRVPRSFARPGTYRIGLGCGPLQGSQ